MSAERPQRILLVAPNVSRKMGGEAFKALMILQELRKRGFDVLQVAHARVRDELSRDYPELPVAYVEDDSLQVRLDRWGLGSLLSFLNAWQLHRRAEQVARDFQPDVTHFTVPISPVLPYFRFHAGPTVIGPLNGNISFPPALGGREPRRQRLIRAFLRPTQAVLGTLFTGRKRAALLISGGERTRVALRMAGCKDAQMVDSLDSGVAAEVEGRPRARQEGVNFRFVFAGRLVGYKGCDLAIRAIAAADPRATLDVIGDGAERSALEALCQSLSLGDRVRFLGWMPPDAAFYDRLAGYRALLFPTLAEANGIIVQEAMALGLPVVGVDWVGPADLFAGCPSALVEPAEEATLVVRLAEKLNLLALSPEEAERLSLAAWNQARTLGFAWDDILDRWQSVYATAVASGTRR